MQQHHQIEELRRKIRTLQYVLYTSCTAAVLFAMCSILVFFLRLFTVPYVVQAKSVEIIGANGEVIAGIGSTEDGDGSVDLFSANGEIIAGIGSTEDGDGALNLFNRSGQLRAVVGPAPGGDYVVNVYNRFGSISNGL